jgi:energy-coupling factor transport system substrate-specific component
MNTKQKLTTKEIAVMGLMIAVLEASVHAMAAIPNVEPVTLLLMLYTLFLGKKVVYVLVAYLLLEGGFYGFGLWWIAYLYIWPLLTFLTYLLRRQRSSAFAWWVAGIPFDLIHCVANFLLCLILFPPLRYCMGRALKFME